MFTPIQNIIITQVKSDKYPNRNKVFSFDFCVSVKTSSTWGHLTDTMTVVMPRKIYFKDEHGKSTTWADTQIYGNPTKEPLVMRGDKIKFLLGYSYFAPTQGSGFNRNDIVYKIIERFSGYITKIKNATPFELECEDNMYACKQTKVSTKQYKLDGKAYTLEKMLKEMLANSTFPDAKNLKVVTDNFEHNVGIFSPYQLQMGQVLDELRKNYKFQSYFRQNELRCGIIRYYPQDRVDHVFQFGYKDTGNIISSSLEYTRADDIRLGIKAIGIYNVKYPGKNSKGEQKSKHQKIEVSVGDQDGEIRTEHFYGVSSKEDLKKRAELMLNFIRYEGFRGSFTTFCLPYVKHGDAVQIVYKQIPEQNGIYLVKQVDTSTDENGARQVITLDIRIDGITPDTLINYQKSQNGGL